MGTQPSTEDQPQRPPDVYAIFVGAIDEAAVTRIAQALTLTTNPAMGIKHVHLLFQSSGGTVGDGVCLYNIFKSLPVELTVYNVGSIQSIGVIAYLGAKRRKTSAHASFLIHRTHMTVQRTSVGGLHAAAETVSVDNKRTESILRKYIKLQDGVWSDFEHVDITFSGQKAVDVGLAHEIGEFSPPPGSQIFNV